MMDNNQLINGKEVSEIKEALAAPFSEKEVEPLDNRDFYNVNACKYYERIMSVVGVENLRIEFNELTNYKIGDVDAFTVHCKITVYYDCGDVALYGEAYGADDIKYMKDKDTRHEDEKVRKPVGFKNAITSIQQYAFKNACYNLCGMGKDIRDMNKEVSRKKKNGRSTTNDSRNDTSETVSIYITTNGGFIEQGKGNLKIMVADSATGESYELVFWKNVIEELGDTFEKLKKKVLSKGSASFVVVGTKHLFKNSLQLHFVKFGDKK